MSEMLYLYETIKLELEREKCVGCGRCIEVCPHQVFKMADRKAVIEHKNRCMECGACAKNCPVGAISAGSGVGCAYAIINSMLGKKGGACECGGKSGCC